MSENPAPQKPGAGAGEATPPPAGAPVPPTRRHEKPPAWKEWLAKLTIVDALLGACVLGLGLTFAIPRMGAARRGAREEAALSFIREIRGAQVAFFSKQPEADKRYAATIIELAASGFDLGGLPEGGALTRGGFVFRVGVLDESRRKYYAIAQPERFDETGSRSFYVDDTGKVRASPGPVVGPAFPEVE